MNRDVQKRLAANPLQLVDLSSSPVEPSGAGTIKEVAAANLLDYAVSAHGRGRLPALIRGLSENETWATLIPSVLGVPAAQFEAGWQLSLANHRIIQY